MPLYLPNLSPLMELLRSLNTGPHLQGCGPFHASRRRVRFDHTPSSQEYSPCRSGALSPILTGS
jgi:hypothetical protein